MADHVKDVWDILKEDSRLNFYLYDCFKKRDIVDAKSHIYKRLPFKRVTKNNLKARSWDLMISPDHSRLGLLNTSNCPILRTRHGVASGKLITRQESAYLGSTTTFGEKMYDGSGKVRYTKMFAVSEANKQLAVDMDAKLEDVIVAVGDLRADKMLMLSENRTEIRKQMGIKPEDKVVFVISTWGEHCLFETMGEAFFEQTELHKSEFTFMLSAHPHLYRTKKEGKRVWGEYIDTFKNKGYIIRNPQDDWMPYMIACDVICTDQTSLAVHGALLNKPYVYSHIKDDVLSEGFLPWRLRKISPKLNKNATNLRDCLNEALQQYPKDKLAKIAKDVNSHPGEAAKRIRKEIYDLLKFDLSPR